MLLFALVAAISMAHRSLAVTPDQLLQSFVTSLNEKDMKSASACVKGSDIPDFFVKQVKSDLNWPKFTISNLADTPAGDRTIVDFHLKMQVPTASQETDGYIVLLKAGDGWLIDGRQNNPLAQVANLFVNKELLLQEHASSASVECLSNVKQLALGFIMFTNDSDDQLKVKADSWFEKIQPYVKNKSILHCPEDSSGNPSYSFNALLENKKLTDIASPAATVLLYEGKGGKLDFRHDGRAAVGFTDGHAKLINAEEAKTLIWKP